MSNKIFPEFQGWSIEKTKTPIWKSNVYESESGRETRTQKWSFPRYRIELNYNFITDNSIQSVTLAKGELEKLQGFSILSAEILKTSFTGTMSKIIAKIRHSLSVTEFQFNFSLFAHCLTGLNPSEVLLKLRTYS